MWQYIHPGLFLKPAQGKSPTCRSISAENAGACICARSLAASGFCSAATPGLSKAVKWATLGAAHSSTRGSGWALSGRVSPYLGVYRASQSRQARPEEAQKPSWGTAKGGHFEHGATLSSSRKRSRLVLSTKLAEMAAVWLRLVTAWAAPAGTKSSSPGPSVTSHRSR